MAFDQAHACELIADGKSLRQVASDLGLRSASNITDMVRKDAHFAAQYARALEDRADVHANSIEDLADRVVAGEIQPDVARVAIDAKKWVAAKLRPKRYGDRIQSDVDLAVTVTVVNPFQIAQDAVLATIEPQSAIEQDK